MRPAVRNIVVLRGRSYPFVNSEAAALVARLSSQPDDTRKALYDTVFGKLKVGGVNGTNVLAKISDLHLEASHDAQAGQRNWITDARNLVPVNSPTFVTDRGYLGVAANLTHLTLNGSLFTDGGLYTQDSSCMFTWETLDIQEATMSIGQTGNAANQFIRGRNAGSCEGRCNDASTLTAVVADSLGLTLVNRSASNAKQLYRNASSVATSTTVSSASGLGIVAILRNFSTYANRRVGASGKGASVTANEVADLHHALNTWMVGVGAA